MPIPGITQPPFLTVDSAIRLKKFERIPPEAFDWYQDPDTVYMVDGVKVPYTQDKLERMYRYLNAQGELYIIEVIENGVYISIGDVTFWQMDMPIVIGNKAYRGQGIGQKVVKELIQRGKALGYSKLYVNEIYHFNTASRRCFEQTGFRICEDSEGSIRLSLNL